MQIFIPFNLFKKYLTAVILISCLMIVHKTSFAQAVWTQRLSPSAIERSGAVGFSIGTKGYFCTGRNLVNNSYVYYKDLWEFDPATNTWEQKANFPGSARAYAFGFSIDTKGYIGAGGLTYDSSPIYKDFYEYNSGTNQWTKKADFAGGTRKYAISFAVGGKGYAGGGTDTSQAPYHTDFWEYNPGNNQWTKKADVAGGKRSASASFAIGNKGYVGTGYDSTVVLDDFWEYDPSADQWNQKASFGGTGRNLASAFATATKGYIGHGNDPGGYFNDFWEYDPSGDSWVKVADFGGPPRNSACAFGIGNNGYVVTGKGPGGVYFNDIWEYGIPVGINEKQDNDFSIRVNTSSDGMIQVSYDLKNYHEALLSFYDLSGKKIFSQELNPSDRNIDIRQNNMLSGMYIYQLSVGQKTIASDKLVILK